jgi:hypothetical protein
MSLSFSDLIMYSTSSEVELNLKVCAIQQGRKHIAWAEKNNIKPASFNIICVIYFLHGYEFDHKCSCYIS